MSKKRVLLIFGTRPEAIKMAPVVHELWKHPEVIEPIVCVTAQHRQMLDQVLDLFGIIPDIDLNLMQEDQTLASLTSRTVEAITEVLEDVRPDVVLVQGDTTTAMAAALASFYRRIPVGHVEAGLRTKDRYNPFPEEINRRVVGVVADLHFAPTIWARDNLLREGICLESIVVTGNPVIDALHWVAELPYDPRAGVLAEVPWDRRVLLVTVHRRENFGEPLRNICQALLEIAARYGDEIRIVYPVHLNPNVQGPIYRLLDGVPNITLLPPLDYLSFIHLLKRCYLVLTDSGGIQEEAPGLGKPVLVLRQVTERPEAVAEGIVRVVGVKREQIVAETVRLWEDKEEYEKMTQAVNPYGDGRASARILRSLLDFAGNLEVLSC